MSNVQVGSAQVSSVQAGAAVGASTRVLWRRACPTTQHHGGATRVLGGTVPLARYDAPTNALVARMPKPTVRSVVMRPLVSMTSEVREMKGEAAQDRPE